MSLFKFLKKVVIGALVIGAIIVSGGGFAALGWTMFGLAQMGVAGIALAVGVSLGAGALVSAATAKPKFSGGISQRMSLDPRAPRFLAVGHTAVPAQMIYWGTANKDNKDLSIVLVHACHEIHGYGDLYISNKLVPLGGGGAAIGDWAGCLTVEYKTGTDSQTAFTSVIPATYWTAAHKGSGLALAHHRWTFDKTKHASGLPQNISQRVKGMKVYDPRLDGTVGGSGSMRANDQTTWAWLNGAVEIGRNPALIELTYRLGIRQNGVEYAGRFDDPANIDYASYMAAANICEQSVAGDPRYTCDGLLWLTENHDENTARILACCGGRIVDTGGLIGIWVANDDTGTVSAAFTDDDFAGGISYDPLPELSARRNTVRGQYTSAAQHYQAADYTEIAPSTLKSIDQNIEFADNISFDLITTEAQARRVASILLYESRRGTVMATMKLTALGVKPMDIVTLTHARFNWTAKKFRVESWGLSTEAKVVLALREVSSTDYAEPAAVSTSVPALPEVEAYNIAGELGGLWGYLTNESHVLAADAVGSVTSFATAAGEFRVFYTTNDISLGNGVVYGKGTETACTATIDTATGAYSVSAMSADTATVVLTATYGGTVIERVFSLSKSKAGAAGADGTNAALLTLVATAQTMSFDGTGTASPTSQTITFTAVLQGISGTVVTTATAYNAAGTSLGAITLGGTGANRTMTNAQFMAPGATAYAVVTASLSGHTDTTTIVRVDDGASTPVGFLTNESHTVPANADGTSPVLTGATGTFKVFNGTTDVTTGSGIVYSVVGSPANVTVSINSATGVYSVTGMTADSVYVTFRATYGSLLIDKVFSLSKSKAGAAGADGTNAALLTLVATAQTMSFDGTGTASPTSQTITFTAVLQGISGTVVTTATAYNAAGTSLGAITLGGTGANRTMTNAQFMAPGATAYAVVTASLSGHTDTTTIVRVDDGANAYTGYLTNESHTLTSASDGSSVVFSGATGAFKILFGSTDVSGSFDLSTVSGGDPQSLTESYNNTVTPRTYSVTGAATTAGGFGHTGTDIASLTIRATGTGAHAGVTIDRVFSLSKSKAGAAGTNGSNGLNAVAVILYKRTTTATPVPTVASDGAPATYTFAGGTITNPPSGWTKDIPANSGGEYLWSIQATAWGSGATDDIADAEWSAPVITTKDGITPLRFESPFLTTFFANYDGTIKSGQVTRIINLKSFLAGLEVTATTAWSISPTGCTASIGAATGIISITAVSGNGKMVVTASRDGVSSSWEIVVSVEKDLPPASGSGGGTTAYDISLSDSISDTYGTAHGGPLVITIGSTGTASLVADLGFYVSTVGTFNGTFHVFGKWQRRPAGGSWVDVGTETQSHIACVIEDGELYNYGSISVNRTVTGLSAGAVHEFQFLARNPAGSTKTRYFDGSISSTGS